MKKSITMLAAALMTMGSIFAQEVKTETAAQNPNAPEITFTKTVHDYGTIFVQGDGNCEFEFTNTGKEPLILSSVKSSCGCTVPSWPREPILPGKKESIKVKYDTNRLGPINKSITVMSNAKNTPVVLRIAGNIVKNQEETTIPEKNISTGTTPVSKK
ncbi:MAG: DUF1573 domain-containing protein [Lentimicrobiaceae bacterium]|nr:DUF1573 domain-containing protein [Lentimicrobiaceae bacterium]MCB9023310.1 DUF1573 domain-containing protein [Lentimicrobiaceae bacterium]MCO5265718.1 DUF1573 domain-containing protein [Lentimicrobium sp.]